MRKSVLKDKRKLADSKERGLTLETFSWETMRMWVKRWESELKVDNAWESM